MADAGSLEGIILYIPWTWETMDWNARRAEVQDTACGNWHQDGLALSRRARAARFAAITSATAGRRWSILKPHQMTRTP
jgi:hypothetical protein